MFTFINRYPTLFSPNFIFPLMLNWYNGKEINNYIRRLFIRDCITRKGWADL